MSLEKKIRKERKMKIIWKEKRVDHCLNLLVEIQDTRYLEAFGTKRRVGNDVRCTDMVSSFYRI